MPLIINADYETAQEKIESERQLVELIQDVRTSISELDLHFEDKPYAEVLRVIEKERMYDIRDGGLSNHSLVRINLSQAASLIHGYREGSEGGCRACIGLHCEKPIPDGLFFWCSKFEKYDGEGESDCNYQSPRVKKYWDKGCEAREPRFKKTVEEVLAVAEEHGLAALTK